LAIARQLKPKPSDTRFTTPLRPNFHRGVALELFGLSCSPNLTKAGGGKGNHKQATSQNLRQSSHVKIE